MTTDPNDIVVDPFAGGGSAAIAARQLGRRYIGAEIDPTYADVANQRYSAAIGSTNLSGAYVSVHRGNVVSIRDVDI